MIFSARERTQVFCNRLKWDEETRQQETLQCLNSSRPDDVHSARETAVFNTFVKTVKTQNMFVQNTQKDPDTIDTQNETNTEYFFSEVLKSFASNSALINFDRQTVKTRPNC